MIGHDHLLSPHLPDLEVERNNTMQDKAGFKIAALLESQGSSHLIGRTRLILATCTRQYRFCAVKFGSTRSVTHDKARLTDLIEHM